MYLWYGKFNQGRRSLHDELRESRSKSIAFPETIDVVRKLILQNCHVTYREIGVTLDYTQFVNHLKKGSC